MTDRESDGGMDGPGTGGGTRPDEQSAKDADEIATHLTQQQVDADQWMLDEDQQASDADQTLADREQRYADEDQAAANAEYLHALGADPPTTWAEIKSVRDATRRGREETEAFRARASADRMVRAALRDAALRLRSLVPARGPSARSADQLPADAPDDITKQ